MRDLREEGSVARPGKGHVAEDVGAPRKPALQRPNGQEGEVKANF